VDDAGFLQRIVELTNIERDGVNAKSTDSTGRITALSGNAVVSMNMWGFTPHIFGQFRKHFLKFLKSDGSGIQSESYLPNTVNELVLAGEARVEVLHTNDSWAGVTYREDRLRVVQTIRHLIDCCNYPNRFWS
jgi:hypothetical protein